MKTGHTITKLVVLLSITLFFKGIAFEIQAGEIEGGEKLEKQEENQKEMVKSLQKPIYFVLGNHDFYHVKLP